MYEYYQHYLSELNHTGKYRKLPVSSLENQKAFIDFSTNDYLGLSRHPLLLQASFEAGQQYGVGATGSRLLSGYYELIDLLEQRIAVDKHTESALVFNTGFQANMSVLAALLDRKVLGHQPLVFFDKLNHASLYQAVFLSGAELIRYHHGDMEHLKSLLTQHAASHRSKFIVTETLFGMDGDSADLQCLIEYSKTYQAFLYLDEAHATGMFGPRGYGLSTVLDLTSIPGLVMGTFSKALGCSGAYIACSKTVRNYLINKAAGFLYSTANSPLVIGAAFQAWKMVEEFHLERERIMSLAENFRKNLLKLGFNIGSSSSHIIPIILGSEEFALSTQQQLAKQGLRVSCVRPPTVPLKSSRLRLAINSGHTKEHIDFSLALLRSL
jgi:8-amino-7-oxononanoate synthase